MAITSELAGVTTGGQLRNDYSTTTGAFVAANAILKRWYLNGVRDVVNSKKILSRRIQRNPSNITVAGDEIFAALRTGRNMGMGYIQEGARLPDPLKQQYKTAKYRTKFGYGRFKITGPAISASRNTRGAFIRLMDGEVKGLIDDVAHEDNRIMFGNGTGRLAQVSADNGGNNYSVINPGGIVSQGLGTQYLEQGQRVAVADIAEEGDPIDALTSGLRAGASTNRGFTIESIDYSAGTITLNEAPTGINANGNDYLYTVSEVSSDVTDNASGRGHEMNGLAAIVDYQDPDLQTTGLGEITAASEARWQSFIVHNNGIPVPFDQNLLQESMDGVDQAGDGVVQLWMTTHGIRRQYAASVIQNKRYVGTMELDGGFSAMHYNQIPLVVDKDCTRGRIYGLDMRVIALAYENDWHWIEEDGAVLHRLEDFDAFQGAIRRFANLICTARNRLTGVFDIQDV